MATFLESGAIAGSRVRLNINYLPPGARSPRELFYVKQAPAHGNPGLAVLMGLLSNEEVVINVQEDAISEVYTG